MTTLAVRLDFAAPLIQDASRCHSVAQALMRPAFGALERVSALRGDRAVQHAAKSVDAIVAILTDPRNTAVALDTRRSRTILASAVIKSGSREGRYSPLPYDAYAACPLTGAPATAIADIVELAAALDVGAGFIAGEPTYDAAQNVALGGAKPCPRRGLSTRQAIERRGRDWHYKQIADELAGPEWGVFLGAAHLARVDLQRLREANAFARVELVAPKLAYLQITADPADDLHDTFAVPLEVARAALAPILMDLSDVNLD